MRDGQAITYDQKIKITLEQKGDRIKCFCFIFFCD